MGTGINVSKANIYYVVQPAKGLNVSKGNIYYVVQPCSWEATGGVWFNGAANTSFQAGAAGQYEYTGSGAIWFGGSATAATNTIWSYVGSGAIWFNGAATTEANAKLYIASGAIWFNGTATTWGKISKSYDGSGAIWFDGTADFVWAVSVSQIIRSTTIRSVASGQVSQVAKLAMVSNPYAIGNVSQITRMVIRKNVKPDFMPMLLRLISS